MRTSTLWTLAGNLRPSWSVIMICGVGVRFGALGMLVIVVGCVVCQANAAGFCMWKRYARGRRRWRRR